MLNGGEMSFVLRGSFSFTVSHGCCIPSRNRLVDVINVDMAMTWIR